MIYKINKQILLEGSSGLLADMVEAGIKSFSGGQKVASAQELGTLGDKYQDNNHNGSDHDEKSISGLEIGGLGLAGYGLYRGYKHLTEPKRAKS